MTALARRVSRQRTVAGDLLLEVDRRLAEMRAGRYPLTRYQLDPVAYVREVLRVEVIPPHQEMLLRAFALAVRRKAPPRVACRSGQKTGKTILATWLACWFYESFEGARVLMCAAVEQQTKNVLWDALWKTLTHASKMGSSIDGKFAQAPASGMVSSDGLRSIKGISGREIEAVAGYSGRQLVIVDEASHLPQKKAEAFEGNSMGGEGYHFWISQPLHNAGPFYEAFHDQAAYWQTFHLNSLEIAKWQEAEGVRIPGLARLEKIDEQREMFGGELSPFYILRVLGDWLRNETGRVVTMAAIDAAAERWASAPDEGRLQIGYDPAGPGDGGDEHAWAVVRGTKCLSIHRRRGLTEDRALEESYSLMRIHRRADEEPILLLDVDGPIGSAMYGRLRGEAEHRRLRDRGAMFEVVGVKPSSKFVRDPTKFGRVRDELWWVLSEWIATGAIPADLKLQAELYAPEWHSLPSGQLQATPKPVLRDLLNRSPDSADALAMAVRQPRANVGGMRDPPPRSPTQNPYNTSQVFDAYRGMDPFIPKKKYG